MIIRKSFSIITVFFFIGLIIITLTNGCDRQGTRASSYSDSLFFFYNQSASLFNKTLHEISAGNNNYYPLLKDSLNFNIDNSTRKINQLKFKNDTILKNTILLSLVTYKKISGNQFVELSKLILKPDTLFSRMDSLQLNKLYSDIQKQTSEISVKLNKVQNDFAIQNNINIKPGR